MYLLARLGGAVGAPVYAARHCAPGVDDELLRRADRHANAHGASLLGLSLLELGDDAGGADAGKVRDALGTGGVLVAVGFNTEVSEALAGLASGAAKTVVLSGCETALTRDANLVWPGVTWAEKDGLIVNFEGHLQRLRPGALPVGALGEWQILSRLLASVEGSEPEGMIGRVRKSMQESIAALAGVDLVNVDFKGLRLGAQTVRP